MKRAGLFQGPAGEPCPELTWRRQPWTLPAIHARVGPGRAAASAALAGSRSREARGEEKAAAGRGAASCWSTRVPWVAGTGCTAPGAQPPATLHG